MEQIALQDQVLAPAKDYANDDERFALLVGRQSRFVFRLAYSILRNVYDAEDAVQETFLKLYRSGRWRNVEDERAFLARVAWRIAIDRLPRRRSEPIDAAYPSPAESAEATMVTADRTATIRRLIDALPEELRQPLALSTVDEMRSNEIAEIMGIPEGTVRSRLSRAREILRKKLTLLMEGRHGNESRR